MGGESGDRARYRAALGLAYAAHHGAGAVLRLLKGLSPEEIWQAPEHILMGYGLNPDAALRLVRWRERAVWKEMQDKLEAAGLRFLPWGSAGYPRQLTDLAHPPAGLFFVGHEERLEHLLRLPRITIVGTRRASPYGSRAARDLGSAFAARGIAVVSGMALGIDGRAHEAALDAGILTVAVLGCGADVVYPSRHRGLYRAIAEKGLILSELPPGTPPAAWTFPHRNRLLAALGDAVVVVEGAPTSGAMQTADHAGALGRPVFAVPGSIYAESYHGCNLLVRDGATPALDPEATVEEFLLQTRIERGERGPRGSAGAGSGPGPGQDPFRELAAAGREDLLEILAERPLSVDALVLRTGIPVREVSAALAELELAGLVRRAGPGMYIRAP